MKYLILILFLTACAGKSEPESDIYKGYSDKSYSEQDAKYYGPDGEGNCFYHGNCGTGPEQPSPPGFVQHPSNPKNIPPVQYNPYTAPPAPMAPQPMPVYPQEYRYSGVQDGEYHWGRVTVDQDGHYRGWDNEGGFNWGTISPQGYYQPPPNQPQPIYPQEYHYSGIQNGEFHWGNVTVQPDGSYSGFDSQGGIFFGNMEAQ